jgi:hypothetical protein
MRLNQNDLYSLFCCEIYVVMELSQFKIRLNEVLPTDQFLDTKYDLRKCPS